MFELLCPAGNMEKLKTAVYFGADAVYFGGKDFGLRAFAGNFDKKEIEEAVKFCHKKNVKAYITVNIFARNIDFEKLHEYLTFLNDIKIDGAIVSDLGVLNFFKKYPDIDVHISTQANVTNKYAAKFLSDLGVKRIILARELSLKEIKEIRDYIPKNIELEAFVHGAMCISYSGRCLLSNYLANRDSNRGECIQACRWKYTIKTFESSDLELPIEEDKRGTYILNSKDLKMIEHLDKLAQAGVNCFKIEGRMKSVYYVATVTNAYRRALNELKLENKEFKISKLLIKELEKTAHRQYTTGFSFKDIKKEESEYLISSLPVQTYEFMAVVIENQKNGTVLIEQRNRFFVGDKLEVLSPNDTFNKTIIIKQMWDKNNQPVSDAKLVQQTLILKTDLKLKAGDILRKKVENKN